MITRVRVRRGLAWAGVGLGAFGLLLAAWSLVGAISYSDAWRDVQVARGALVTTAHGSRRNVPTGGPGSRAITVRPRELTVSGASGQPWHWLPRFRAMETLSSHVVPGRLVIPWWLLVLIGAVCGYCLLPSGRGTGRCQKCGFDLSRVPVRGGEVRCPECGLTAAAQRGPDASSEAPAGNLGG